MWDVWFLGQIVYSKIEHPWIINKMKRLDFSKDKLTITEGADEKPYCGNDNPPLYVTKTKGEALTISFETDNSITKTGFRIEYTSTECKTLIQDNYYTLC